LVRHCDYENPDHVNPFRNAGYPLSSLGRREASSLAEHFSKEKIAAIYSSPLLRCQQTAHIIAKKLGLLVKTDDRLLEVNSPYAGMNLDQFNNLTRPVSLYALPLQIEKGETPEEIYTRLKSITDEVLTRFPNQNLIFVSHGDPIMILLSSLRGQDISLFKIPTDRYIPKGGVIRLVFSGSKLVSYNQ